MSVTPSQPKSFSRADTALLFDIVKGSTQSKKLAAAELRKRGHAGEVVFIEHIARSRVVTLPKVITELEILKMAEQICFRDQRDITSEMIRQVIAERKDFYKDRPVFL